MHHSSSNSNGQVLSLMTHHRHHHHDATQGAGGEYPHLMMHPISAHQSSNCPTSNSTAVIHHVQSNSPDFRVPSTPPALVSSSTCSPPAQTRVIMRPPPPPPVKLSRTVLLHASSHQNHQEVNKNVAQHQEEPSSSIPDLEFDGTTVLCRVCGDKASGFHYGVHSCEGCKGFFRRSIQQKIQYRPCTKNQQCSILRINRNRCQYCRLKKCIAVGMSRDAVRFGRVPKREKARILAAMQQSTNSRSQEKALSAELEDDQRLLNTVVRAHLETCDFTTDKVQPMILQARTHPSFTACPPTLACPLNPNPQPLIGQQELLQDFSKRFSPAIRGVVEFAKRITGFSLLPQDDQVTLLKAGVFEVLLVRLACMFDSQTNSMICLNGQVLKRDSVHNNSNARFLMDSMFEFSERLNTLHLSDAEIGLFSSVVVIAPDRPGLRNMDMIEKMHNKLKALLQTVLSQNHPNQPNLCQELIKKIPDLRTLNTLHSEKLLAFKMTEQQQQMEQHASNLWNCIKYKTEPADDCDQKSPIGAGGGGSWSSGSDAAIDEVKSPMGSVSSTESMCSGEVASLSEANAAAIHHHHHHHNMMVGSLVASHAPLLAATLASGVCPMRHRNGGGADRHSSSDDDLVGPHTQHHHMAMVKQQPFMGINNNNNNGGGVGFRKSDSPTDSGIESGTEKIEKVTNSAPTSVCSSPRSTSEDKDDHHHNGIVTVFSNSASMHGSTSNAANGPANNNNNSNSIEDMPVLKRVLQAPPLYDTSSLMDEAYKPHKKFRALRHKDTAEAEPAVQQPAIVLSSCPSTPTNASINISVAGTSARNASPILSSTLSSPPASSISPHLQYHLTTSSLSSTHSTLARSLMEGPRMTPEQMKRTDIIHNFIMRGADTTSNYRSGSPNYHQYIPSPPQQPQVKWEHTAGTSVITRSPRIPSPYAASVYNAHPSVVITRTDSLSPAHHLQHHQQQQPVVMMERLSPRASPYMRTPHASPSACASPLHYAPSNMILSPASSPPTHMMIPPPNHHLQFTNGNQQPLNLSKKTPPSSPSPRPLSASSNASSSSSSNAHIVNIVSMEA